MWPEFTTRMAKTGQTVGANVGLPDSIHEPETNEEHRCDNRRIAGGRSSQVEEMHLHMNPEDESSDRRGGRRRRTLKGARIIFNGGYSSFSCTVRNFSESGALLNFGDTLGIPAHFELDLEGTRRPCTVRWRDGGLLGVSFDDWDSRTGQ